MNLKFFVLSLLLLSFLYSCGNDNNTNPAENKIDTVKIGPQIWMTKNLDVSTYRNGDVIPQVTDATQWGNLTTGAWCYYKNEATNGAIYGKLYNWYAVNDVRGLAPSGWHLPSDAEWTMLSTYIGGDSEGGKLKESGITNWASPNTGATNSSGFSALPGGYRNYDGSFYDIGGSVYLWSSTGLDATYSWYRFLDYNNSNIKRNSYFKKNALSVRCVKD